MKYHKKELDFTKSVWGAALVGIGVMAAVDTIIFIRYCPSIISMIFLLPKSHF